MYMPRVQAQPLGRPDSGAPSLSELLPLLHKLTSSDSSIRELVAHWVGAHAQDAVGGQPKIQRRTPAQDMDTTIGIVVGVLLGVFFIGAIAFLYVYGKSIRVKRRRRRHRKSPSSKSSSSDGAGAAAAPAPAAGG